MTDKKEIDQIVLSIDERIEKYFLREGASANQAEGSFIFQQKELSLKKKVIIVI